MQLVAKVLDVLSTSFSLKWQTKHSLWLRRALFEALRELHAADGHRLRIFVVVGGALEVVLLSLYLVLSLNNSLYAFEDLK